MISLICKKYGIENYTINPDGSIDVNGNVSLSWCELTELPLTFNKVTGYFNCIYNDLTSLKNSPNIDDNTYFLCSDNKLTNLIGVPSIFGDKCALECNNNKLTSLEGAPREILKFDCSNNELTSLEYAPRDVKFFSCYSNKLESLIGGPTYVEGDYNCYDNRLDSLEGAPVTVGHS